MLGRCTWQHRKSGKKASTPKADFHWMRDGKIRKLQEFHDSAAALAAVEPEDATPGS